MSLCPYSVKLLKGLLNFHIHLLSLYINTDEAWSMAILLYEYHHVYV